MTPVQLKRSTAIVPKLSFLAHTSVHVQETYKHTEKRYQSVKWEMGYTRYHC